MPRIEHFALFTNNLEALKDFYCETFGMKVLLDNSKAPVAGYFLGDDNGVALEIILRPPGTHAADTRYMCHVAFLVDNVAATQSALESKGFAFEPDTVVNNEHMITSFFRDPEGNRVQLLWRSKPLGT